jgi:hypothetical protein
METILIPAATLIGILNNRTRSGINIIPPPTPKIEPINPAIIPTKIIKTNIKECSP